MRTGCRTWAKEGIQRCFASRRTAGVGKLSELKSGFSLWWLSASRPLATDASAGWAVVCRGLRSGQSRDRGANSARPRKCVLLLWRPCTLLLYYVNLDAATDKEVRRLKPGWIHRTSFII